MGASPTSDKQPVSLAQVPPTPLQTASLDGAVGDSQRRLGLEGRRWDLGVLLVHGVGEQQRGDTLTEAGDRLLDWLRRNFDVEAALTTPKGGNPREMTVADVVLRQTSDDEVPAAHAVVRFGNREDEDGAIYWVVAESWWADVFRVPSFTEVAFWGVTVGHWAFATQIQAIRQRMQFDAAVPMLLRLALLPISWLAGTAMVLLAGGLSLLLTIFALILLPVAISKIPVISDVAAKIQKGLAGGVGDAYVLTRSPLRFGAMASQVRSDLQTLRKKSYSVALVAHSQGTAVAWAALKREILQPREEEPEIVAAPITLFVTYGQALRKLTLMLMLARGDVDRLPGALLAMSNSVLLVVAAALFAERAEPWTVVVTLVLAIVVEFALLLTSDRIQDRTTREIQGHWCRMRPIEPYLRWVDLWASADPVPVGPLGLTVPDVTTYKIQNLASLILDHVVYWQNSTEFLEPLAAELHTLGGPAGGRAQPLTSPRLQVAALRRHARVRLLLAARTVVASAIVAAAAAAWFSIDFADDVIGLLRSFPFATTVFNMPAEWIQRLAGVIVVLISGVITWGVVSAAWGALIRRDDAAYVCKRRAALWEPVGWPVFVVVLALFMPVATLMLAALHHPLIATIYAVAAPLAALLTLIIFAGGGASLADDPADVPATPCRAGPPAAATMPLAVGASPWPLGILDVVVTFIVLIAIPVAAFDMSTRPWAPAQWALLGEAFYIGIVLAAEGWRQYHSFHGAFNEKLAAIPGPV